MPLGRVLCESRVRFPYRQAHNAPPTSSYPFNVVKHMKCSDAVNATSSPIDQITKAVVLLCLRVLLIRRIGNKPTCDSKMKYNVSKS